MSMRVLLADDHALFAEGLKNLLASHDIEVVGVARDGLEALDKARRLKPDVILMDITMPRCNGLAATRLIKAELPDIKIVMLTMSEADADLFESIKSGASGYLLKNLNADELVEMLRDLAQGDAPFSPGLAVKLLDEFTQLASGARTKTGAGARAGAAGAAVGQEDGSKGTGSPGRGLTPRQMEVLNLVARGMTYKEVGAALYISERTVKYHMKHILDELHLQNRAQVIAYVARMNLNTEPSN
ncbi:MAG: hypothetical protein PWR07_1822 [Bacillota bacterium]|nr:hypothetical protein [Bacillota bacterium]